MPPPPGSPPSPPPPPPPGSPPLPPGVQYFVQVCGPNGTAYAGTLVNHAPANKEFEEQDFIDSTSTHPTSLAIAHHDGGGWGADNTKGQTLTGTVTSKNNVLGYGGGDVLNLSSISGGGSQAHFGVVDLGSGNYVNTADVNFSSSKIQWNHNGTLTVTLGTPSGPAPSEPPSTAR